MSARPAQDVGGALKAGSMGYIPLRKKLMLGLLAAGLVAAWIESSGVMVQQAAPLPQPTAPSQPTTPATPPTAQAGALLFTNSGCIQCHGPEGNGTAKAPNIHEVRKRSTEEEIYLQIMEGKGAMPAFGEALSEDEIRSIVAFLHAKDGWKLLLPDPPAK